MTLTTLIAAVRRQLLLTTDDITDAKVTDILNEGIRVVASAHEWTWLEDGAGLDVTADTVEVNLPSDFMFVQAVVRNDKGYRLRGISFPRYRSMVGDDPPSSTNATLYYIKNSVIGFFPTPSATETGAYLIYFYKTPTELSAGGDSPQWSSLFHHILVDYATYRIYEREEMMQESATSAQAFDQGINRMIRFYNRRGNEGNIIWGEGTWTPDPGSEAFNLPFLWQS